MSETREKLIEIGKALGFVLIAVLLVLAAGPFLEGFRDGWRAEVSEKPASDGSQPEPGAGRAPAADGQPH
jgi:hypothetical protein